MRILFVVHQFMPEFAAGTERVTFNLAKSAQAAGHHVEVLTCAMRDASMWAGTDADGIRFASIDGIPVYGLDGSVLDRMQELGFENNAAALQVAARFLDDRHPYDLVHIVHPMRMLDLVDLIRQRRLPYVLTLTDFYIPCWHTNLIRSNGDLCGGPEGGAACIRYCSTLELNDRLLLSRREHLDGILLSAAAIVACSDYVARVFNVEYPHLDIRVIPHGIDLLSFGAPTKKKAGRAVEFGYIGTLSEMKGVHVLVEAFAKAAPADATLHLAGPAYDDSFTDGLQTIAASCPGIRLSPPLPARDVAHMLSELDIICLPSLVPETFSLAIHEGFAAGLPCLVSDLGNPAEVIRRHGCGATTPAGDVQALAAEITRIATEPDLIASWRSNIPTPPRVEEEGFLYSQIYRGIFLV